MLDCATRAVYGKNQKWENSPVVGLPVVTLTPVVVSNIRCCRDAKLRVDSVEMSGYLANLKLISGNDKCADCKKPGRA